MIHSLVFDLKENDETSQNENGLGQRTDPTRSRQLKERPRVCQHNVRMIEFSGRRSHAEQKPAQAREVKEENHEEHMLDRTEPSWPES